MFCAKCGNEIKQSDASFCNHCSAAVGRSSTLQKENFKVNNLILYVKKLGTDSPKAFKYIYWILAIFAGLYFFGEAWKYDEMSNVFRNLLTRVSSPDFSGVERTIKGLGLKTLEEVHESEVNTAIVQRNIYIALGFLSFSLPFTSYICRFCKFLILKLKIDQFVSMTNISLKLFLLIFIFILGVAFFHFGLDEININAKANIKNSCVMNGLGQGSCSFTNTGEGSGSVCGRISVRDLYYQEIATSSIFCSGKIKTLSTNQVNFSIPDVIYRCPRGLTGSNCDFQFIENR